MFFRMKKVKGYRYLQIIESYREGGRMRQRVLMTLANYEHLKDSGKLDSLLASGARLSEKLALISEHQAGKAVLFHANADDLIKFLGGYGMNLA